MGPQISTLTTRPFADVKADRRLLSDIDHEEENPVPARGEKYRLSGIPDSPKNQDFVVPLPVQPGRATNTREGTVLVMGPPRAQRDAFWLGLGRPKPQAPPGAAWRGAVPTAEGSCGRARGSYVRKLG